MASSVISQSTAVPHQGVGAVERFSERKIPGASIRTLCVLQEARAAFRWARDRRRSNVARSTTNDVAGLRTFSPSDRATKFASYCRRLQPPSRSRYRIERGLTQPCLVSSPYTFDLSEDIAQPCRLLTPLKPTSGASLTRLSKEKSSSPIFSVAGSGTTNTSAPSSSVSRVLFRSEP